MTLETARGILYDCVFNAEYAPEKEQEEAYNTIFPKLLGEDCISNHLELVANSLYPTDYNDSSQESYNRNTEQSRLQYAFCQGGNHIINKTIEFLDNYLPLLQSECVVSELIKNYRKAMEE